MNKKTKSFAVGLVTVLCFLLVFAIGFGVTGAWYQANRQASGTVKMDQGIYLKFTNLKTLNIQGDLENKLAGKLLLSDGTTELNDKELVPGQLVQLSIPTIAAAKDSVDFYARVKVTYTAKYEGADGEAEGDAVAISADTMKQLFGTDLSGQLQPGADWSANTDGYWYYVGSVAEGSDPKLAALQPGTDADGTAVSIFGNDGKLQFADWTAGNSTQTDPSKLVEKGGPTVTVGEETKTILQLIVTLDIEVIQSANNTAPTGWAISGASA